MDVFTATDGARVRATVLARLRAGAVAILATDTLYGLSCDATQPEAVARVLALKGRTRPCSMIPPSEAAARRLADESAPGLLDHALAEYRGRYTLLCRRRPDTADVAFAAEPLVGLRLPDHDTAALATALAVPLLSTSVNRSGAPPMTCLDDLDPAIAAGVDFIVWEGARPGPASTLVFVEEGFRQEER